MDHQNVEDGINAENSHIKSHSNLLEVDMIHAVLRDIVRQGVYSNTDITVLLSRAQHGLYLIGNSETYSNISK